MIRCDGRLELTALPGLPLLGPGDDLPALIARALERASIALEDGDVIVVASKAVSRAEGRFVDLTTVVVSEHAKEVARATGKDPRLVELILREAQAISRTGPNALVVRHKLGFVTGDAGIDCSNASRGEAEAVSGASRGEAEAVSGASRGEAEAVSGAAKGEWALLLPEAPDASAERIRAALAGPAGAAIGVVISDSFGRPFRIGTVGAAIGVAGLPALADLRGSLDLHGRALQRTITALADQVAAAADLVAGQAAEGRAAIHVRGLHFPVGQHSARELCRPPEQDLYA